MKTKQPKAICYQTQNNEYLDLIKCSMMRILLIILLSGAFVQSRAGGTPVYTITSGATTLTIRNYATNNYGLGIQMGNTYYEQTKPCAVEVVTTGGAAAWITGYYSSAVSLGNNTYKCVGTKTSTNGSVFSFTDTISLVSTGIFQIKRNVKVTTAKTSDAGFSTRLIFAQTTTSAMTDYDFFAPGVWYKDNVSVADNALATDLTDYYYWFREDRLPLPVFMLRKKSDGSTLSVCHKDPDGSTFTGEDGLNRVIDSRLKFASIGMQNNTQPSIGILFPGSEGERTGIYGMSTTKRWAYRSNPVTLNYTQRYTLALSLTSETSFDNALKNTWINYYNMFNPSLYSCDLNQIYLDQLALINNYWSTINNSAGFPFRVKIDGTVNAADYNWNMGFVGMELPNGAILLREGINSNNTTMISRAEQVIDWWANNSLTSTGCPRTWYDPSPQTWRSTYPTYTRVVGDGMDGMLWAWNFEKKRGVNKPNWLNACYRVANWLLTKQNADGSFPRAWDYITDNVVYSDKTNTSHVIPFLVDMYKVTGNVNFKNAAINAGNYIYTNTYQNFQYVGGTPDNPNVPDKEAVSMALRAFLSLYDTDNQTKWLDAATQAAYYYETWVYAWNVPIPADDAGATYPKNRTTTGLSIIATGNNGADSYAAIDAFNFYRMYLYKGDAHLLQIAKFLLRNTKQAVNWDRNNPISGFGAWGILEEAQSVMIPRGHGVGYYLPWQTYNLIEPFVLFWDAFQADTYDIATIDALANKATLHSNYSTSRNFISSGSESVVNGGIYIIVNRNSGKVLDVAGESLNNGGNIQQWQYLGKNSQHWQAVSDGNGYFELVAQNSNKCADVEGSSLNNGANISQFTPNFANNQLWSIVNVGGGYWKIVNKNSGKVMNVDNSSVSNGANVSQYTDNSTANQQWLLISISQQQQSIKGFAIENDLNNNKSKAILYPNPAQNELIISNDISDLQLEIINCNGQKLFQKNRLLGTTQVVDLTHFERGMYVVKLTKRNGSTVCEKFLKL